MMEKERGQLCPVRVGTSASLGPSLFPVLAPGYVQLKSRGNSHFCNARKGGKFKYYAQCNLAGLQLEQFPKMQHKIRGQLYINIGRR